MPAESLPPEFVAYLRDLERYYLAADDPIVGSGFHGGAERWEAERRPILDAVERDVHLLDVGCANGYLLECLVGWAAEDGIALTPHGVDIGAGLIALARERLPAFADNMHVGNAWEWEPPRQYDVVYTIWDCVPADYLEAFVHRLLDRFVTPGGRFVLGAYGSRSRKESPFDAAGFLSDIGLEVVGARNAGNPPTAAFAWTGTVS
jgi:SAM-dependent methyltransferase